jgi:predicted polyphosphate/ATP-dependent NAD kinase
VVLLVLAAVLVIGAVPTGSWPLVSVAAVAALVLGAAATRITHSELMDSRREANRDRALQAKAYNELDAQRTAEHQAQEAHLTAMLAVSEQTLAELETALAAAHQRAADAIRARAEVAQRAEQAEAAGQSALTRMEEAEARAAEAIMRVSELEQELDVVRAELNAERATLARWRNSQSA